MMTPALPSSPVRRRPRGARGFTLVELLVALSGGLFLSMVVFALARDTNRFYQRETRLANATLANIVGFDRLRADIARAGFLTTPNILEDPHVCTRPSEWPDALKTLSSIRLEQQASVVSNTLEANGLAPMVLKLAGSYVSNDEFPIRAVTNDGTNNVITLQVNTGPLVRLGYSLGADAGAQQQTVLQTVFMPGRIIRIVDKSGFQHFAVIGSVSVGDEPKIILAETPSLQFRAGSELACGLKGLEAGATVNVVNLIEYRVAPLSNYANYNALQVAAASAPFEAGRTELMRRELAVDGVTTLPGTQPELVAEYAVDLDFDFTRWENTVPALKTISAEDDDFLDYFPTSSAELGDVQHVRSIRARLSVRSREADRSENVQGLDGLYRIGLGNDGGAPFARVRTLQADIALHNHGRIEW